jgi:Ca2+-binding EF-hand superfamily protein
MNSISVMSGSMGMLQNMYGMQRPSPKEAAQQLFSELDTSGQGYIELSDLESAFQQVSSVSSSSSVETDESDLEELFSQIDSDGDGKVTEEELTDSLTMLDQQMSDLFAQMRMGEAMGSMQPPPPENDEGFTEEELSAQLEEIGDSDSERSTLIQSILDNFAEADSDGDGKVSMEEAMAYGEANGLGPEVEEMAGGMMPPPPPPPPPENDQGFTLDELTAQLEEISADDSERAAFIQNIIDNFYEADSDGDGRVNLQEAMSYNEANSESAYEVASSDINSKVMMQIMQLMQAYNIGGSEEESSSTVSVTA